jgi:hypothetical protein
LRELLREETIFPLRLTLKGPTTSELGERFEQVRNWIADLTGSPQIRIEHREFKHRVLGTQRVPGSAWVDDLDSAIALVGKQTEMTRFRELLALTQAKHSPLTTWLDKYPLRAISLADQWGRLLDVADWIRVNPRPNIYLRQVDISGIHSKFIEAHLGVLADWLDLLLPAEAIETNHIGTRNFAARYGFLDKPNQIRFRVLDAGLGLLAGTELPDVTLDSGSFARLRAPIRRVFIIENEITFLAFPPVPTSIVIFGAGYGHKVMRGAGWIAHCSVHYWGDIDTHGFAILDQLRAHLEHAESFLMDRSTLLAHEPLWGLEESQIVRDLPRLTTTETALFDELRDNHIRKGLRLEQERIGFRWVRAALDRLVEKQGEISAGSAPN